MSTMVAFKYRCSPLFSVTSSVVNGGPGLALAIKGEVDSTIETGGQVTKASGSLTVPLSVANTFVTPGLRATAEPKLLTCATEELSVVHV